MSGLLSPLISIVLGVQAVLFFMTCHSTLVVCKLSKVDPQFLDQELSPISDAMPENCYAFPGIIFSLSDYLVERNLEGAKKLVAQASEALITLKPSFDILYASGILLTYASNIALYLYLIYVPYLLVKQCISLAIRVTIYGTILFFAFHLLADKWVNSFERVEEKMGVIYQNMDEDQ